jgi:hypothetical protein
MRSIFLVLTAAFALAGCASTKHDTMADKAWKAYDEDRKPASSRVHLCVAKKGPDCRAKIMWHCPDGFVDGCAQSEGVKNHQCVRMPGFVEGGVDGIPCENEIAMNCGENMIDACNE